MSVALDALVREARRAPMARAALPFMTGLAVYRALSPDVTWAWGLAAVVGLAATIVLLRRYRYGRRAWRGALLGMAFFTCGGLWWTLRDPFRTQVEGTFDRDRPALLTITEVGGIGERSARYEAVVEGTDAGPLVQRPPRVLATLMLDTAQSVPRTGDRVWIRATPHRIDRIPDPGGFDRRAYAASRGIDHEVFVPSGQWHLAAHAFHWTDLFVQARQRIADWLEASGLPKPERALAKALLIGVRDELDQDQKQGFVRSGTMHVLAVSGAHVGLIWAVLNFMLAWWGKHKWPRLARGLVILLALWAYAGLTGAEPSVLRATVMCSLFTIGGMVLRASAHLNSLFAASLVLLLWDPLMLWQLSFQLSFLAVLGIILFYKPLLHLWEPPNWILHHLWSAVAVSLAAQITTTPLSMFVFRSFPVWFLPANVVVVGVVTLAVYGCALLLALHKVPLIGAGLAWCMTRLLLFLGKSTAFFGQLPWAYPGVRMGALQAVLLFAFLLVLAAWVLWRGRVLRWTSAVLLLAFLWEWAANARELDRTVRFAVHDRTGSSMVSLQAGRALYVFAPDSLLNDRWTARGIASQERALGADRTMWVRPDRRQASLEEVGPALVGEGFVAMPGLRVRFCGPYSAVSNTVTPVDVLVLDGPGHYDLDAVLATTPPRKAVVLTGVIDRRERNRLRVRCAERGIACHDVARSGAYLIQTRLRDAG